jgi:uncharacterized membrane protein YhaH (DUF805 family)
MHNGHFDTTGDDMDFQQSVKVCLTKYADFTGRASRPEYWWFVLFIILGSMAAMLINDIAGALFNLATFLPSIAVAARRLHDTGRTGWWQLIVLIPLLGWIVLIVFLAQKGTADDAMHSLKAPGEVA